MNASYSVLYFNECVMHVTMT